jgi:hypothetical protein
MRGKSFCLDARDSRALTTDDMSLPSTTPLLDSLAGYPPWFVAACVTIVAAVGIWIFAKLLKWSLYLLMVLVVISGVVATGYLIFK